MLVVTLDVMLDTDVQAFVTYFAKSKKTGGEEKRDIKGNKVFIFDLFFVDRLFLDLDEGMVVFCLCYMIKMPSI